MASVVLVTATLPDVTAAVEARYRKLPFAATFQCGEDWIEVWDALERRTVRVLRYRRHMKDGIVIETGWLSCFSIARLGTSSLFKRARSRWEIENQGFNDTNVTTPTACW